MNALDYIAALLIGIYIGLLACTLRMWWELDGRDWWNYKRIMRALKKCQKDFRGKR